MSAWNIIPRKFIRSDLAAVLYVSNIKDEAERQETRLRGIEHELIT